MSFIKAIGQAVPKYAYHQHEIAEYMLDYLDADERLIRQLKILYKKTAIKKRHSVLPDFHPRYAQQDLFNSHSVGISNRMNLFQCSASELAIDAIKGCISIEETASITHLITVSCTGLSAPGLEIKLAQDLGLAPSTSKLSVNFMGCYGAFHGLKIADAICNSQPNAKVLVVCVELCSIHFTNAKTDDSLRANSLFADGAAAVLLDAKAEKGSLELITFYNELLPQGEQDMTWEIGEEAFSMKLTSYIPNLVKEGIGILLNGALKKLDLNINDIAHWAIHPGGIKILETVKEEMNLAQDDLNESYQILAEYGNMSSPTVLFVLKEILKNGVSKDENIFASGFGPGLTLESCVMKML